MLFPYELYFPQGLYTLFVVGLLLTNALAVLHEKRFLAKGAGTVSAWFPLPRCCGPFCCSPTLLQYILCIKPGVLHNARTLPSLGFCVGAVCGLRLDLAVGWVPTPMDPNSSTLKSRFLGLIHAVQYLQGSVSPLLPFTFDALVRRAGPRKLFSHRPVTSCACTPALLQCRSSSSTPLSLSPSY